MPVNWLSWVLFHVFVVGALAFDLGVVNRRTHVVHFREAIYTSLAWIAMAAVFAFLLLHYGHVMTGNLLKPNTQLSLEFVTGYLVEKSLSVDNLFVFLLIFRYFRTPAEYQHKVLFWGILGALVARGIFIFAGVALINRFHWLIYVFGAFLLYVGAGLLKKNEDPDPGKNVIVRFFKTYVRTTSDFGNGKFFIRHKGKGFVTQLLLVLLVVETTDIVFATDSIPAVLAITRDPFIVYTSNVFAILGLRALYFALSGLMDLFHFLHYGLAVVLMFIGAKMLASHWFEIPIVIALGAIVVVLSCSIAISLAFPKPADVPEPVK